MTKSNLFDVYDGNTVLACDLKDSFKNGDYIGFMPELRLRLKKQQEEFKQSVKYRKLWRNDFSNNNWYLLYKAGIIDYYLLRAVLRIMTYQPALLDYAETSQTLTNKMRLRGLLHTALLDYNKSEIQLTSRQLRHLYKIAKRNTFIDYDKQRDISKLKVA